jgi:hypothetical protein
LLAPGTEGVCRPIRMIIVWQKSYVGTRNPAGGSEVAAAVTGRNYAGAKA